MEEIKYFIFMKILFPLIFTVFSRISNIMASAIILFFTVTMFFSLTQTFSNFDIFLFFYVVIVFT